MHALSRAWTVPDPPRPWRLSIPTLADDAAAACEHLGIGPVVAVGFSMGFPVALELYRRHRERVAGLLSLAGPSGRVLDSFQGTQNFRRLLPLALAATKIARDVTTRTWRKWLPSPLSRELSLRSGQVNAERIEVADLELYMRGIAAMNPELFLAVVDEAQRHSAADVLPTIAVPTLVVAGARDNFVPLATMRALVAQIPAPSGRSTPLPRTRCRPSSRWRSPTRSPASSTTPWRPRCPRGHDCQDMAPKP
ncbi:alpha/beta fold hydrolase [Nannocystis pusilla]|uniref:alpha/beta fold hydrolase n=1 Tax=Nannocystis pusilla TaxID=889268 RepID=UPI003B7C1F4E